MEEPDGERRASQVQKYGTLEAAKEKPRTGGDGASRVPFGGTVMGEGKPHQ